VLAGFMVYLLSLFKQFTSEQNTFSRLF